jgi:hypothetical protein
MDHACAHEQARGEHEQPRRHASRGGGVASRPTNGMGVRGHWKRGRRDERAALDSHRIGRVSHSSGARPRAVPASQPPTACAPTAVGGWVMGVRARRGFESATLRFVPRRAHMPSLAFCGAPQRPQEGPPRQKPLRQPFSGESVRVRSPFQRMVNIALRRRNSPD